MKQYDHAQVKFNGGTGALLCNGCSVVLEYGFNHKDCEHYCEDCDERGEQVEVSKRIRLLEQRIIDLQGHDDLSYIDRKLSEQEGELV